MQENWTLGKKLFANSYRLGESALTPITLSNFNNVRVLLLKASLLFIRTFRRDFCSFNKATLAYIKAKCLSQFPFL